MNNNEVEKAKRKLSSYTSSDMLNDELLFSFNEGSPKTSLDEEHGKIFSFDKVKSDKKLLESITIYKSYIQTLSILEVQQEIDYQLSQINIEIYDRLHFCKIDCIISILENRSTPEAAGLIRKIRHEIYQRVKNFYHV